MQHSDDPSLESYRAGVKICGVVTLVVGATWLAFAALFVLVGVLGGLGVLDPHETAQERVFGVVGMAVVSLIGIASGAVNLAAGLGMRRFRPWGRTAGVVAAVLNVVGGCGCLVGIGLGIWMLVVLLDSRAPVAFADAEN